MERIYIGKTDLGTKIGVFGILETGLIDGDIVQIVKFNDDLVMVEYIENKENSLQSSNKVFIDPEGVNYEVR